MLPRAERGAVLEGARALLHFAAAFAAFWSAFRVLAVGNVLGEILAPAGAWLFLVLLVSGCRSLALMDFCGGFFSQGTNVAAIDPARISNQM